MTAFKEVTLIGTPYQRGLHYGQVCREEIAISVKNYKALFQYRKQLSWERAQQLAAAYLPAIRELDVSYIDEMQGIADGSGFAFSEILAINARSELLHTSAATAKDVQECTAFSAIAPATRDSVVLAGQTWDFALLQRQAVVIVRIPGNDVRPTILFFPEAGMIGGKGLNNAGLSLTLNALYTQNSGCGVPIHIRMRRILECSALHTAYECAVAEPIPAAANLMLTHKDGLALNLELDPSGVDVLMPEEGVLVHTNHFIGSKMCLSHAHASGGSTYIRLQRARQLFCHKTNLTVQDAEAAFQDHKGYPASICAHPSAKAEEPDIAKGSTNFGLVMDLTHGIVRLACGNPCTEPFRQITIN